jgi:hypothetical protein
MILVMTVRTLLLKCPIVMPWRPQRVRRTAAVHDHPRKLHTHLQVYDADVLVHHGPPAAADERLLQVDGLKQLGPVVQHHLPGQALGQLVGADVLSWFGVVEGCQRAAMGTTLTRCVQVGAEARRASQRVSHKKRTAICSTTTKCP